MENIDESYHLCRVCLTKTTDGVPLGSPIDEENSTNDQLLTVLETLETVTSQKLLVHAKFPDSICAYCKQALKMAYDFRILFQNSQTKLAENLEDVLLALETADYVKQEAAPVTEDFEEVLLETADCTKPELAPVELIFSGQAFNLKDVVIVEENTENGEQNFDGFLNNLGSTLSAVFVNKTNEHENKKMKGKIKPRPPRQRQMKADVIYEIEERSHENERKNDEMKDKNRQQQMRVDVDHISEIKEGSGDNGLFDVMKTGLNWENVEVITEVGPIVKRSHKCSFCDFSCPAKSSLVMHEKSVHGVTCGAKSGKKIKGRERERPNKQHLCDICGHTATNMRNLAYHKQSHGDQSYQCHICQKTFRIKISYTAHVKSHNGARTHLCTVCGKTFYYSSALVYHMRIHRNERNFVCTVCGKRFYMPCVLKRHMRIHTGDRPYGCAYCPKGFRSNGEKRKHEMIHTGERPYKCRFCERTFLSSFNRSVHHMAHAGPHACDHCHRTFADVEFLRKHVKDKHSDMIDEENKVVSE